MAMGMQPAKTVTISGICLYIKCACAIDAACFLAGGDFKILEFTFILWMNHEPHEKHERKIDPFLVFVYFVYFVV